jgi:glutamate:GABA antiporter
MISFLKKNIFRSYGFISIVIINIIAFASTSYLPGVSDYSFVPIFWYLAAGLIFLLPCTIIISFLTSNCEEMYGIYSWVKEAFGIRFGFLAVFLQWLVNIVWGPVVITFTATIFAYAISPEWDNAMTLASNKIYLLIYTLMFCIIIYAIITRGFKFCEIFIVNGAIYCMFIPTAIIFSMIMYSIYTGKIILADFSVYKILPNIMTTKGLDLTYSLLLCFIGIEGSALFMFRMQAAKKRYPIAILVSSSMIFIITVVAGIGICIALGSIHHDHDFNLIKLFSILYGTHSSKIILRIIAFFIASAGVTTGVLWFVSPNMGLMSAGLDGAFPAKVCKQNKNGMPYILFIIEITIVALFTSAFVSIPSLKMSMYLIMGLGTQAYLFMYILMFLSAIKLVNKYKIITGVGPLCRKSTIRFFSVWGVVGVLLIFTAGFFTPFFMTDSKGWFVYVMFQIIGLFVIFFIPVIIYNSMINSLIFKHSDYFTNTKSNLAITLAVLGLVSYALMYIFNTVLTSFLPASAYGEIYICLRLIIIFSLIIIVGTNFSAKKHLSRFFEEKNNCMVQNYIRWNIFFITKPFLVFISILIVLSLLAYFGIPVIDKFTLGFLWIVPFNAVLIIFNSYIQSNKWPILYYFFNKIASILITLFFIGVGVVFFGLTVDIKSIIYIVFISILTALILEFLLIRMTLRAYDIGKLFSFNWSLKNNTLKALGESWSSDAFKLMINFLIIGQIYVIGLYILKYIGSNNNSIGYYSAILVITNVIFIMPSSITSLMDAGIAPMLAQKKYNDLQSNITTINRFNICILILVFSVIVFFSEYLLSLFGEEYIAAQIPLIIQSFALLLLALFLPSIEILTYWNSKKILKFSITEALVLTVSGFVLVYYFDLLGLSIAVLLTSLVKVILVYLTLKKNIPISPLSIFKKDV